LASQAMIPAATNLLRAAFLDPRVQDMQEYAVLLELGRGLARRGLQGHAGQRGAICEQPVLDLGIAGGGMCHAGLLVIEIAARHPCARIRADGQPCLGHRGE
jgi:hypothetical protein